MFVTSSSLHRFLSLFNLCSQMGRKYSVFFQQEVIISWCLTKMWYVLTHSVQCLAEIYVGVCFCWADFYPVASRFLKRSLLSQSPGSLKKPDMLYVLGKWWQSLFITWWICQTDPCSNLCLSPSFRKTMCDSSYCNIHFPLVGVQASRRSLGTN